MKIINGLVTLLWITTVASISGSNVLIFNTNTTFSIDYLISVNTPAFEGRADALINPVLPPGVPILFTKVTGGTVVAMTASESNSILATIAAQYDAAIRAGAISPLVDFSTVGLLQRAFADTVKDEINIIRNELSVAKTNISKFQSTPTLSPRTFAQLQTALTNKVASHTVDTNTGISLLGPRKRPTIAAVRAPKDINR